MLPNWQPPFSSQRAKMIPGRGRLPKELKEIAAQNRVSPLYGVQYLKAAEPMVAQPTARQFSDAAHDRPTKRDFALRARFGLSGASPYQVPLNSLNSSIN
jgi:hypothetical protein